MGVQGGKTAASRGWLVAVSLFVVAFRGANVWCTRSYFVPDEFWQGPEVAHRIVYGQGHLTWEWESQLRGALYPLLLALPIKALSFLDVDSVRAVRIGSKLFSWAVQVLGDYSTYELARRVFGQDVGLQALLVQLLSWSYFFTMSRTLTNALETSLSAFALSLWPWPYAAIPNDPASAHLAVWIAALSFMVRPTGAILFVPIGVEHALALAFGRRGSKATLRYVGVIVSAGACALIVSALIDKAFFGLWTVPAWNFLKFNVLGGGAEIYGVHPWHWYLSQGLPVTIFTSLPLGIVGIIVSRRMDFLWLILWVTLVHSALPHKEFRFILPILPLAFAYAGAGLSVIRGIHIHRRPKVLREGKKVLVRNMEQQTYLNDKKGVLLGVKGGEGEGSRFLVAVEGHEKPFSLMEGNIRVYRSRSYRWLFHRHENPSPTISWLMSSLWLVAVAFLALTNLPIAYYLASIHQRGSVDVIHMPTGREIELYFLDCSPEGYRPAYSLDARCSAKEVAPHKPAHPLHDDAKYCADTGGGRGALLKARSRADEGRGARGGVTCASSRGEGPLQHGLDEADRFFQDPEGFLKCAFPRCWWGVCGKRGHGPPLPTHVVVFSGTAPRIQGFLDAHGFERVAAVFHTHFPLESRISTEIWVYGRS